MTVDGQAAPATAIVVQADGLDVRYGRARALFSVSMSLRHGSVHALLGPNGAGKSTLGRALSGLIGVSAGKIWLDGRDITGWAPHRIRRAGLTYIPEGRGIFPGLSVIDNLRMAVRQAGGRTERQAAVDRAIAQFPVLGRRTTQRAGSMSGGEQQMLALARALAVEPRVVIADEMSLGLGPIVVDEVLAALQQARDSGVCVLLIEQFIHRALAMADSCAILSRGHLAWSGPAADAGAEVLAQYLGENSVA